MSGKPDLVGEIVATAKDKRLEPRTAQTGIRSQQRRIRENYSNLSNKKSSEKTSRKL